MSPEELSDPELVSRCLDGDGDSWQTLVERYSRLVYSVPTRMGLGPADIDDVYQETFIVLLKKLGTVRDRERIGLWLAATARRKALDRVSRGPATRESRLPEDTALADPNPLPAEELLRIERQHLVRAAVARLPERCQTLLEGLYFRNPPLKYAQLAEQLQISANSLGPTRRRCFDKLRSALREVLGD